MNLIFQWLGSDGGQALLLALGHSLWIGLLVYLAAVFLLRSIPAGRAGRRYALLMLGQLLILLSTLLVWSLLNLEKSADAASLRAETDASEADGVEGFHSPGSALSGGIDTAESAGFSESGTRFDSEASAVGERAPESRMWSQWVGGFWLTGLLSVLLTRLRWHWKTRRLCQSGEVISEGPWKEWLEQEKLNMAYRGAVVLRSVDVVTSPAVFGFFRPVLLVPTTLIDSLPVDGIRAILIHELSHLKRMDPLVHALQQVFEAIFFFNPFVWLLSRQSSIEREACADARTAKSAGVLPYTQLLVDLGRSGQGRNPVVGMAVTGDGSEGSLKNRVLRLLQPASRPAPRLPLKLVFLAMALSAVVVSGGRQLADSAVEALSHRDWMQRIQAALELERRERLPVEWVEGDTMVAEGRITNSLGDPIPKAVVRFAMHRVGESSSAYGLSAQADDNGTFSRELNLVAGPADQSPFSAVTITAVAPGYAPVARERVPTRRGATFFEFELERGTPVEVVVQNSEGEPVAGAEVRFTDLATGVSDNTIHTTAEDGTTVLLSAGSAMSAKVRAEGYRDIEYVRFEPAQNGRRNVITLTRGEPIRGVVRDRRTGKTISGAEIGVVHSQSTQTNAQRSRSGWIFNERDRLAVSDEAGVFEVHSLPEEWEHWLIARAEGYLIGFSGPDDSRKTFRLDGGHAVSVGGEPVEMFLYPRQELDVKILPPEGWLKADQAKARVRYDHVFVTGHPMRGSHSHGTLIHRKTVKAVDGALHFSFVPSHAAPLRIGLDELAGANKTIEGWNYEEPIVVDLRDAGREVAVKRDYVIQLAVPEGQPRPKGTITVDYSDGSRVHRELKVPVEDGEARFRAEARADRSIRINSRGLIGYYFEEQSFAVDGLSADTPVSWTIDSLVPAGAFRIQFKNLNPDWSTQITVKAVPSVFSFRPAPGALWPGKERFVLEPGEDAMILSPIPFQQKIELEIRHQNLLYTTRTLIASDSKPFQKLTVQLPDGEHFEGRLIDPDGKPLADRPLTLNYVYPSTDRDSYRTSHIRTRTSRSGYFSFERVNFDAGGTYYVSVSEIPGYVEFKQIVESVTAPMTLQLEETESLDIRVVSAESGGPLSNVELEAVRTDVPARGDFMRHVVRAIHPTDAGGRTRFTGLPSEGEYTFRARMPWKMGGGMHEERHVLPGRGATREITIQVPGH